MYFPFVFTSVTWILFVVLSVIISLYILFEKLKNKARSYENDTTREPDGPVPFPVIGSSHLLAGYRVPFEAFRALANVYGDVFKIRLGTVQCIVVNGLDNIREVLMTKGDHFDGRPNFQRYNFIFDGDKQNSLAFCDWSELQKTRRKLLRPHMFPRSYSSKFNLLDSYISLETDTMLQRISITRPKCMAAKVSSQSQRDQAIEPIDLKPLLSHACANVFMMYFCGKRYEHGDKSFEMMIRSFDQLFYEVNQGFACDFMPWMVPFYRKHFDDIRKWTKYIRNFTTQIVNERYSTWNPNRVSHDYIDTLIETVRRVDYKEINMETAMFSLDDIIGGHSAIANFLTKVFAYVAIRLEVQERIRVEIESVTKGSRPVHLTDRRSMTYTQAVILETIRLISSPIVPYVASQDSSIAGYRVKKGTMIFLNNFDLNYDPKLWHTPEQFNPEKFLKDGCLVKPDHFFPFSIGRRSCMGYKMVQLLSFSIIAQTLQRYQIKPVDGVSYTVPIGDLALPLNTFKFRFVPWQ